MEIKEDYKSQRDGLLIVIKCLHEMINASGSREKLTKSAKEKIVEMYPEASKHLSKEFINEQLRVSNQRMCRWTKEKKCKLSITTHCYNSCPTQLTFTEQNLIKTNLLSPENNHLPRNHIWAKMKRNGFPISKHTFYRYANSLCGKVVKPEIIKPQQNSNVYAKEPFQILHMDSTMLRCKDGHRVYVHFIMDNYSRKILGAVADDSIKSIYVAENLKQVIENNNLYNREFELYCDDGPENRGLVDKLITDNPRIKGIKVIANYKKKLSNNMIESWNKKFKYYILKKYTINNYGHLIYLLPKMIEYANNLYLPTLQTLTPNEAISGMRFEDLNFIQLMEKARHIRIEQNQNIDCKKLCMIE